MLVYVAGSFLRDLDREVSEIVSSAWSDNTLATRNSQWGRYLKFCADNHLTALPAVSSTVARFLVYLGRSVKYNTINNYLSAIVVLHKFYDYPADFRGSFYVQLALRGLKAKLGATPNQMVPLSPEQLLAAYRCIDTDNVDNLTMWAALIFSFRTLLRKSNLVPDSIGNSKHVVLRKHVTFEKWGMMVNVHSTKTLQCRERVLKVPVYYSGGSPLCAVTLLRQHWAFIPGHWDSAVFLKHHNGEIVPILYNELLAFLKRTVKVIGLDPEVVGLHSMRRSGASFLVCRSRI